MNLHAKSNFEYSEKFCGPVERLILGKKPLLSSGWEWKLKHVQNNWAKVTPGKVQTTEFKIM